MGTSAGRRALIITLGVCLILLFLVLGALNAFNLKFLNPESPIQTLVFITLSTLGFLLFVGILVLLGRNLLKLYADQRSRLLGSRLRTRMLWGAVLVSMVPLTFMFAFSYLLMNRAVDRWFSQPVTEMRDDSNRLGQELTRYASANARSEAESIAASLGARPLPREDQLNGPAVIPIRNELRRHQATLQGGFAVLFHDGRPIASVNAPVNGLGLAQVPDSAADDTADDVPALEVAPGPLPLPTPVQIDMLRAALRADGTPYAIGGTDFVLAAVAMHAGDNVLVGLPLPAGLSATTARLRNAANQYWMLFRERRRIRNLYMGYMLLTTGLALFVCCWLALNLSKQVTRPVESLAEAMEAIAAGDYARRVSHSATEELGELADSFNTMAADLESARSLADQSTGQLSEANAALRARRTELETIIETIPNGVVTLSPEGRIVVANRAFGELIDPGGQKHFAGLAMADVFPRDIGETLDRLERRSHRMGSASAELQIDSVTGPLHLSATAALLEGGLPERHALGYVLVFENITELLRAQKQSAWKEVARRVAHEIKNPLTPISLNAEQIHRHIRRLSTLLEERGIDTNSTAVIQRSSEVITSSVETMRSLVDQFSALAQFPSARPRPADINAIVDNSLALFGGRLGNIRVVRDLASGLPLVLADPEALKRALSNLIDNAAEAMHASLLRELHITTHLLDSGMVELTVADTGPGVTDEMRERLFLPYFSTKERGTGLGLSIASQIMQEHRGSIRVEKNLPVGARFILELRPAAGIDPDSDPQQPGTASRASNEQEVTA